MIPDHSFCGGKLLLYDQGCLHVRNSGSQLLNVYAQSSECYECSLSWLRKVHPGSVSQIVVQTTSETFLELINSHRFTQFFHFGQHGHYNVTVNETDQSDILTDITPQDAYAPLKIELWILFIAIILWCIGACTSYYLNTFRWLFQTSFSRRELLNDLGRPQESSVDPVSLLIPEPPRSPTLPRAGRVQFIDVFRGLSLVLMIFVNYGGGKYWFFEHAPWNGLTIADIVFPSFAFVMGMSQLLSLYSLYRTTNSKKKVLLKIFLRSLLLICLGVILNSFNNPNILTLRLPGVLQRLGLSYFIVGVVEVISLKTHFSTLMTDRLPSFSEWASCCGIVQWIIMVSLLLVHSGILFFVQVPGCPLGYIGPGGLHMNSSFENCTGGVSRYLDDLIFTPQHMYNATKSKFYRLYGVKVPFDPEGILGSLTTSFTVFLGVCAVRLYLMSRNPNRLITKWVTLGIACGLTAGILCNWSKEGGLIPVNKRLWSVSYTLLNGSIGFFIISILYFIIDYKKIWNGSPFSEVGKNPLLIYIGHELLRNTFPWAVTPLDMTDHTEILFLNTWSTSLWILIAVLLAKNNVIVAI